MWNVGRRVRLLTHDGRNAELAGGFPSDPILSGPRQTPWFLLFCDFFWTFYFWKMTLYHRERICFHLLLAATRRRRKITKPLTLHAPISINQATLNSRSHFNQPGNFEHPRPLQSIRQKFYHLHTSTESFPPHHMAWDLLLLPAPTADSTLLPHTKAKGTHTPILPFEHGILWCGLVASIWPSKDIRDGQTEVKITMVVISVHETT